MPNANALPVALLAALAMALPAIAAEPPTPTEGDFVLRDFRFASGEVLPELRLHVYEFNTAALGLYHRLGYTTTSRHMRKPIP